MQGSSQNVHPKNRRNSHREKHGGARNTERERQRENRGNRLPRRAFFHYSAGIVYPGGSGECENAPFSPFVPIPIRDRTGARDRNRNNRNGDGDSSRERKLLAYAQRVITGGEPLSKKYSKCGH